MMKHCLGNQCKLLRRDKHLRSRLLVGERLNVDCFDAHDGSEMYMNVLELNRKQLWRGGYSIDREEQDNI